jgi:uncharacterized protein
MANDYKTPGVYVEEIPKLPPSVAMVETAIPAFIGYTEKAEKNGESVEAKPTRISSMIEFETYYGGSYKYSLGDIKVQLDEANNFAVKKVSFTAKSFYLYDAMRQFFDNGGGDCYIISVGLYVNASFTGNQLSDSGAIVGALLALEKYDEPTIIVIPDAVNLSESEFYSVQQKALDQCDRLQDRVAIFDLREHAELTWDDAYKKFRNNIGINALKYGAAYTPWLYTSYARTVDYKLIRNSSTVTAITLANGTTAADLSSLSTNSDLNTLVTTLNTVTDDQAAVEASVTTLRGSFRSLTDKYNKLKADVMTAADADAPARLELLMLFVRDLAKIFTPLRTGSTAIKNADLINALDSAAKDSSTGLRGLIPTLIGLEKNTDITEFVTTDETYAAFNNFPDASNKWLLVDPSTVAASATNYGDTSAAASAAVKKTAALAMLAGIEPVFKGLSAFYDSVLSSAKNYQKIAQDALYANNPIVADIVKSIKKLLGTIPPTPAVAGIMARVDNKRGVWKAPANESVASVVGPSFQISFDLQKNLNVDAVAGKSINAIRTFTGKGTLVWGARTLAGNDNEWRYISVRRFFNMVEESSKKATEPFVFEPNDANTWVKVQGMIENFLTTLWRAGALQGAKPEHAFYVAVGLGKTMTALDILEGRMIVEIGMAVVRPAEFIILRFSHKMAES